MSRLLPSDLILGKISKFRMYLIFPFLAAVVFALGSMVYKRAFAEGAGLVHVVAVNNALLGLVFLPLLGLESRSIPWDQWYLPVITAATFAAGHVFNVLSLRLGDVSVATPLLGAKVIFVGIIGLVVFGVRLAPLQWLAAGLASAGVIVVGLTDLHSGRKLGRTTWLALACAASFALTDVTIQKWGGRFGALNFLPLQFAALGILSLCFVPWMGGMAALRASRNAWKWILIAVCLSGLQSILITATIATWQDATGVNVIYATRGWLSVVLVWCIGPWLKNRERQEAGARTMLFRAIGAGLLLGAVAITAWTTARS